MIRVLILMIWAALVPACAREVGDTKGSVAPDGRIAWTGKARDGSVCDVVRREDTNGATANFEPPQHLSSECGEPANCTCSNVSFDIARVMCVELAPEEFAWGDCLCRGEFPDGALCRGDEDCQHECVEGICATRCASDADCPGGWVCEPAWGNVPDLICQVPCCNGSECGVVPGAECWLDTPGGGRLRCSFDYGRVQLNRPVDD